jgi:hypothetical protein
MQNAARITVLLFSLIAVVVILLVWKKGDRKNALSELSTRFGADVSINGDEFYLGCSSPTLTDLTALAEVVARVGEPTILDLTGAPALRSLSGVEKMPSLRSLVLIDCGALVSAEGVSGHPGLTEIVLTDSAHFAETAAIRDLPRLTTLDFSGCLSLTRFEASNLPVLENLYLSRCHKLGALDVSAFPTLRQLYADGCGALASIDGLPSLVRLTDLDVSNATGLQGLPGVGSLAELIVLDIRNVEISDFTEIATLPKLRILRMGGQDAIETLEPLSSLTSLRELHLEACPNFRSLKGMPPGISQYAGFTHCPQLVSLEGLGAATGLEQLDLTGCTALTDISQVAELGNLVQLSLVKCRQVTEIKPVEKLPKLVIVMLGGSGVLPASVESLSLANAEMIFDFAGSE